MSPANVVTIKHTDVCCLPVPIVHRLGLLFGVALAGTVAYLCYARCAEAAHAPRNLRFEPEPANNLDTARAVSPAAASTPRRSPRELFASSK